MTKHLRVFAIATVLGLGAYAGVWGLILVSKRIGLLAWLAG